MEESKAKHLPPNVVLCADFFECAETIAPQSIDLLFVDPPYNLTKQFNQQVFRRRSLDAYAIWLESWLPRVYPALKIEASVYICGDWRSSGAIHQVCEKYFTVRNRITFEREKGRGARNDWKNSSEDIWFCTVSKKYFFDSDAVKLKRRVIAPYRLNGTARDWDTEEDGKFRLTNSSNLWTDITVPFWSMSENTPHPTQKPEKLLAKILLASSRPGDRVLDPFAGSGTTGVVAKKLGRQYQMIELDEEYCLYALRRLELAEKFPQIQGYNDGVFWERNSAPQLRPQASRVEK
ncbi:MAG: site-specific DNA-methyltransferase [Leptospirales bacterium]